MKHPIVIAFAIALLAALTPREAAAQDAGTCSCNNGCHDMPGQCLISGTGCALGYAPLCDYRPSGTCPHVGAVSCNSGCTCTAIPGFDAGSVDVQVPPTDATDVVLPDVVIPDVVGVDTVGMDIVLPDVQGIDVQGLDTQASDVQQPDVRPDVNLCPSGVVVDGVCYSTPCQYQNEIGFVCTMSGFSCRQIDGMAWCIPVCAGMVCPAGAFCDPVFGCSNIPDGGLNCATLSCPFGQLCDPVAGCIADLCTNVSCPIGEYCVRGACIPLPDGSGSDTGTSSDGGVGDGSRDGSIDGGRPGQRTGCNCRTAGDTHGMPRGVPTLLVAIAALAITRRRRAR